MDTGDNEDWKVPCRPILSPDYGKGEKVLQVIATIAHNAHLCLHPPMAWSWRLPPGHCPQWTCHHLEGGVLVPPPGAGCQGRQQGTIIRIDRPVSCLPSHCSACHSQLFFERSLFVFKPNSISCSEFLPQLPAHINFTAEINSTQTNFVTAQLFLTDSL